jgi:hypothetical protein
MSRSGTVWTTEGADYDTGEIADHLRAGRHVILLGEYGSGKSRCVRELFRHLAETATGDFHHPLAVDLREAWGLRRGTELIRRHFDDLGLEAICGSAIKAFNAGSITILLDGFDELGSQAWNNDPARLREIRARALQGVKDVVQRCKGGVLIAGVEGRRYGFNVANRRLAEVATGRTGVRGIAAIP